MAQLFETEAPVEVAAYAKVALEQGIDFAADGLTYAVPVSLSDLRVGQRVTVPLGRGDKPTTGYVIHLDDHCDLPPSRLDKVKTVLSRDAGGVSLTPDLIELAKWMAGYYCCPLGMVLVSMLPAAVKHGTGRVTRRMVGLSERGTKARRHEGTKGNEQDSKADRDSEQPRLTRLQRTILDTAIQLRESGHAWTEIKELADLAGAKTTGPITHLLEKGLLVEAKQSDIHAARNVFADDDDQAPDTRSLILIPQQDRALTHLAARIGDGFSVNLLHGVTGSGKTEIYLRAIEHVLAERHEGTVEGRHGGTEARRHEESQKSALVLVPEIALTPQTVARFHRRFGVDVAVLHSGLTAAQRHEQWRRIRDGKVRIVVGARSAVFAPLPGVGIIIVDEEHESSYKQDQLPRYHARDVAIKRAQLLNIPIVLGSATPSLESYYNATTRKGFHYLHMPGRVAGLKLPKVDIVDLIAERRKRYEYTGKGGVHLLSLRLETAIRRAIEGKGQVMLLLNRRGYANYIACPDHRCGWMMQCEFCDATMVYHKSDKLPAGGFVHCHHCTAKQQLPPVCPQCGKKVTVFGLGVQRVEEELERKFPGVRLLRMDSDSMRTARDYHDSLARFRKGEVDILLGTQMIAKGLDFPNVRLVGVISGDTSLHMPDFRAAERTFQLIAQVAGRTGRGTDPGLVIVQSFSPTDPAITLAAKHDYVTFAARELEVRTRMGLPPITRMARIICRDKDHLEARKQANRLHEHLAAANQQLGGHVRVRPPAPCPISRIAEFYRVQIELIAPDAATLQKLLTSLRNARLLKSDARTAVDVDPVALS